MAPSSTIDAPDLSRTPGAFSQVNLLLRVDLIKAPPIRKVHLGRLPNPPNAWSMVNKFSLGNCFEYFAFAFALAEAVGR